METDYSNLSEDEFIFTIKKYVTHRELSL